MLPPRFAGAVAKFERALVHIRALHLEIKSFSDSKAWQPENGDDVPEGMVRIRLLKTPPNDISLILGDAVHNLRSALDYATCSLVELGSDSPDLRHTQFPFGEVGRVLTRREKDNAGLGKLLPHALDMIEEARRCGGAALGLLNLLSNQDKHRLLLAVVSRQFPMRVQIDPEANIADFVPDPKAAEVWLRPISDGDVIKMPLVLNLRLGIEVEGQQAPVVINYIDQIRIAVSLALRLMESAINPTDFSNSEMN